MKYIWTDVVFIVVIASLAFAAGKMKDIHEKSLKVDFYTRGYRDGRGDEKTTAFKNVQESLPHLYRLGLRGHMKQQEGLFFLEKVVSEMPEQCIQPAE